MKRNLVRGLAMVTVALATLTWSGCAMRTLQLAAERGDAKAQIELGDAYQYGRGVRQDYDEAVQWYRRAAEQGNAEAECYLGMCYEAGSGVQQNKVEAAKWYRKAAEQGNDTSGARCRLFWLSPAEYFAMQIIHAEQGDTSAQCDVCESYKDGRGVPQDLSEAYKWFILSGANDSELRDALMKKIAPEQISEGKNRAAAFVPKKPPTGK